MMEFKKIISYFSFLSLLYAQEDDFVFDVSKHPECLIPVLTAEEIENWKNDQPREAHIHSFNGFLHSIEQSVFNNFESGWDIKQLEQYFLWAQQFYCFIAHTIEDKDNRADEFLALSTCVHLYLTLLKYPPQPEEKHYDYVLYKLYTIKKERESFNLSQADFNTLERLIQYTKEEKSKLRKNPTSLVSKAPTPPTRQQTSQNKTKRQKQKDADRALLEQAMKEAGQEKARQEREKTKKELQRCQLQTEKLIQKLKKDQGPLDLSQDSFEEQISQLARLRSEYIKMDNFEDAHRVDHQIIELKHKAVLNALYKEYETGFLQQVRADYPSSVHRIPRDYSQLEGFYKGHSTLKVFCDWLKFFDDHQLFNLALYYYICCLGGIHVIISDAYQTKKNVDYNKISFLLMIGTKLKFIKVSLDNYKQQLVNFSSDELMHNHLQIIAESMRIYLTDNICTKEISAFMFEHIKGIKDRIICLPIEFEQTIVSYLIIILVLRKTENVADFINTIPQAWMRKDKEQLENTLNDIDSVVQQDDNTKNLFAPYLNNRQTVMAAQSS